MSKPRPDVKVTQSCMRALRRAFVIASCALVITFIHVGQSFQLGISPSHAQKAANAPIATGARLAGGKSRTRFVVDLTHAVGFNVSVLSDPYRVIIDLPDVNFQLPPGLGRTGLGLVTGYRFGRFGKGRSRIVLDAKVPVLIEKSFSLKSSNGRTARLVLDLVLTSRKVFLQKQALARAPDALPKPRQVNVPTPRTKPKPSKVAKRTRAPAAVPKVNRRRVIVIDAGHGGVDPGAIGRNGTTEKTVVLAFAKALSKILKKRGNYKVVMTRKDDRFLRLRARVNIARHSNAALFIAIHADSIKRGKAHGSTIYTLSENASDSEAAALAAKENRADIIAGVNLKSESTEVTGILIDLAQRETKNHSVMFAKSLVWQMKRVTRMAGNPHRSAGFRVLKAPDVPSVLVELGYLSSRRDVALMKSSKWRAKTAAAIAKAVDKYFSSRIATGSL